MIQGPDGSPVRAGLGRISSPSRSSRVVVGEGSMRPTGRRDGWIGDGRGGRDLTSRIWWWRTTATVAAALWSHALLPWPILKLKPNTPKSNPRLRDVSRHHRPDPSDDHPMAPPSSYPAPFVASSSRRIGLWRHRRSACRDMTRWSSGGSGGQGLGFACALLMSLRSLSPSN